MDKARPSLQLSQQQRLVMTPQLQQALKILQLNTVELEQLIQAELAENPMLEELEPGGEGAAAEAGPAPGEEGEPGEAPAEAAGEPGPEAGGEFAAEPAPGAEAGEPAELVLDGSQGPEPEDWAEVFSDDGTDYSLPRAEREEAAEKPGLESFLSRPETLQEHLLAQLEAEELEAPERAACEEVLGRLDERGYLESPLSELARESGRSEDELFRALRRVQALDPPGVGARDPRECLLLQLEARGERGSPAWRAVEGHFPDIAAGRWERLGALLGLDEAELRRTQALLGSLEPIPGRPFGGAPNAGVRVDASVEREPQGGGWRVQVNDGGLPRLGYNAYYQRLLRQGPEAFRDPQARAWLREKQQAALWLVRGIAQRHRTLRRVLEEIVEVQQGFLEQGPAALQPLTLKDIAQRTGLHESTISRVASGKRVQTPQGVFELKYFFASALRTDSGGDTSSRAVKDRLRELVEEEAGEEPLSDQALAAALGREGVQIARRTVAKYREELGLAPAHLRRKPKKL